MSIMSAFEGAFCRSAPWSLFADRVILPRVGSDQDWNGTVLEIGGGAGAMADRLLTDHPQVEKLVLVDIDPVMVEKAAARLAHHGDRADVVLGDGKILPVDDHSVDVVCAWLMLHHVIDWKPLLAQITTALAPGGRFVGYDLTRAPLGHALHGFTRSEHLLIEPDDLRDELVRLGYEDVDVQSHGLGQVMTFSGWVPR